MSGNRETLLCGRWGHLHEEDFGEVMVFRPADYPFPPARGRTFIELRPDGSYIESSPGPVDVPEEQTGQWTLEGDLLVLAAHGDRPGRAWQIAAATHDGLTLKRVTGG